MRTIVKLLLALLMAACLTPAQAQPRDHGPRHLERPMPAPERRMGWDERQRLREQVRNGQMSREEARQQWRERRGTEPGRSHEERERLRRDVMEANRHLERR
jgi:hypothetical protein